MIIPANIRCFDPVHSVPVRDTNGTGTHQLYLYIYFHTVLKRREIQLEAIKVAVTEGKENFYLYSQLLRLRRVLMLLNLIISETVNL